MSEEKRILVVDDSFETLEFLRSLLELTDEAYHVVGVPSGEEAGLELLRYTFEALLTDLRLPGMSGPDLVKRAHRRQADLPVIIMSDLPKRKTEQELENVSVFRTLYKPLDADDMLAAVQAAIFGEPEPEEEIAPAVPDIDDLPPIELPKEASQQLEALRSDTGARRLILGAMDGRVAFATVGTLGLDVGELAPIIARNISGSHELADELGSGESFTIQYQSSDDYEVYTASIGKDFFIAMFFDAQNNRARIGTIWVLVRRSVKELRKVLPRLKVKSVPIAPAEQIVATPKSKEKPAVPSKPAPEPEPEPAKRMEPAEEQAFLAQLGVEDEDDEAAAVPNFDIGDMPSGMSFEEAMKKGLLPADLAANLPFAGGDESEEVAEEVLDDSFDLLGGENDVTDDEAFDFLTDLAAGGESDAAVSSESAEVALTEEEMAVLENLADAAGNDQAEIDSFWNAIVSGNTDQTSAVDGMSFEEAMQAGLLADNQKLKAVAAQVMDNEDDSAETNVEPVDDDSLAEMLAEEEVDEDDEADAFWDSAVAGDDDDSVGSGLSFEEAMKKGLISGDLDL